MNASPLNAGPTNAGPVLIMAGGTGGHVFPALAVAKVLRARGVAVVWLGVPGSMESRLVPAQGFPIEWVRVAGLRGKGLLTWLLAPLRIFNAVAQAVSVLKRVKPRSVLGAGGYVSGPGGIAAWLMRIPLLIHEQNAMGRSPRLRLEAVGKCMGGPQATRVGVGGTLVVPNSAGDQLDAPGHLSARVDALGIPVLIACDARRAGDAGDEHASRLLQCRAGPRHCHQRSVHKER